jgi:hypothetical protein
MERGLALALFVMVSLGVVAVKLMHKSGVMESKSDWHQYLAEHTTLWLFLVPFVYAALCELARGSASPKIVLTLTRAIGVVLLVVFAFLLVYLIFDF